MSLKLSIITPSFNMLNHLKLCHASIADQKGVDWEHIVIDGGSTDGTLEWLKQMKNIRWISEKDNGMYDALNKGLKIAKGDILAYLNCDEQYLPGTLEKIREYFVSTPQIDILFGGSLLLNTDGRILGFRKVLVPRYSYIITSHLYNLSCAMFFRKSIIDNKFFFNDTLKAVADMDFVLRVLEFGFNPGYVNVFLSIFTMRGNNLGASLEAKEELISLRKTGSFHYRIFRFPLNIVRWLEKVFSGVYFTRQPIEYSVYTHSSFVARQKFIQKAYPFWLK